ncbi:MAG: glutamate racemase [Clostridiales bacterium]|nr:glutamate racemase [Clostridiales bacterium]
MDNRPIGFFDSGLGGISVLGEALQQMPNEDFVYFGDTLHIPYGDKPPAEVLRYTHEAVSRLIALNCKAIVLACNTATSVAAGELRQELEMPIIGMEPALKPASLLKGDGAVLVLATHVTLTQPKFHSLMHQYGKDAVPIPCPGLMECVEAGELEGERVESLLHSLLSPYLDQPIKSVVLGCTHYVFLRDTIARFFSENVALIDGNAGTVRQLGRRLSQSGLLSGKSGGTVTFLSSMEDEETLQHMQKMFMLCNDHT